MKIRSVLPVFLALTAMLVSAPTLAQESFTLRLAETWGPNFPIFGDASRGMAKMAEDMSGGGGSRSGLIPPTSTKPRSASSTW